MRLMPKRRKLNNRGFSLVELIIVIAIMAILAASILPSVMKYIKKARHAKYIDAVNQYCRAIGEIAIDMGNNGYEPCLFMTSGNGNIKFANIGYKNGNVYKQLDSANVVYYSDLIYEASGFETQYKLGKPSTQASSGRIWFDCYSGNILAYGPSWLKTGDKTQPTKIGLYKIVSNNRTKFVCNMQYDAEEGWIVLED